MKVKNIGQVALVTLTLLLGLLWRYYQPASAQAGPHLICGTASSGPITIQGEGFTPGVVIQQLRWDDVVLPFNPAGLTVGNDGRFSLQFTAPTDTYTLHTLQVIDTAGEQGECYLNLIPSQPTPTRTATPTLTPTPTATPTPGPPPSLPVPPTPVPGAGDYCALITAALVPGNALVGSTIRAGLNIENTNISWGNGQVELGVWQYHNSSETDTGVRGNAPALAAGASTTMQMLIPENELGSIWYQFRLIETATSTVAGCVSDWFPLYTYPGQPFSPALLVPANNVWLNTRQIPLDPQLILRYRVSLATTVGIEAQLRPG